MNIYLAWTPIDKGTVIYTKKKIFAQFKGPEGQIHKEFCRSGRYAKLWLKRNKSIMFVDCDFKPIVPLEYIKLNFTISKENISFS